MEEHCENVLRQQAAKKLPGRLLVDVIDLGGAELLGFFVGFGGVSGLKLDARRERGLGAALFFFGGGLDCAGDLRAAQLDQRQ